MRFDISQSLYPDGKIRFIARDKDGIVRLRKDTLEKLQEAIVAHNNALAVQALEAEKAKEKPKTSKSKSKEKAQDETIEAPIETQTAVEPQQTQATEPEHKDLTPAPIEEVTAESTEEEPPELIIEGGTEPTAQAEEAPAASAESSGEPSEPKKEFLQNDLKEQVEEKKKKTTGKASFWDKLK